MIMRSATAEDLARLRPEHTTFVGIDSDGCVFDTMGVKQRDHFHPLICRFWNLEVLEPQVRAAAEFVNLTSKNRGRNRFTNLLVTFELLHQWDEVRNSGTPLPKLEALRAYCNSGLPLGNPSLIAETKRTNDPELQRLLSWSLAVNDSIDNHMRPVDPFPWALTSLKLIAANSDAIVVSQTPEQALMREWNHHNITHLVKAIAGQEIGTKAFHLTQASNGRYDSDRVLMIGDAPGDLTAANEANTLFYPISPGREDASWRRFHDESYSRFLNGTFDSTYSATLNHEFLAAMPDTPPWHNKLA